MQGGFEYRHSTAGAALDGNRLGDYLGRGYPVRDRLPWPGNRIGDAMKSKIVIGVTAAILLAGCATIKQEVVTLSDGTVVDYVVGKVDSEGQTGVFRDAFVEGKIVASNFGNGASLTGQILQGAFAGAMVGGGMAGAAVLTKAARITQSNGGNQLSNTQNQQQTQDQVSNNQLCGDEAGAGNLACVNNP